MRNIDITSISEELFNEVCNIIERNGGKREELNIHSMFDLFLHSMAAYSLVHKQLHNEDYITYLKEKMDLFVEYHKGNLSVDDNTTNN